MFADYNRQFRFKVKDAGFSAGQDDGATVAEGGVGRFEEGVEQAALGLGRFQVVAGQADELARPGKGRAAGDVFQGDAGGGVGRFLDARLDVVPVADQHLHHFLGRVMVAVGDGGRGVEYLFAVPHTQLVIIE